MNSANPDAGEAWLRSVLERDFDGASRAANELTTGDLSELSVSLTSELVRAHFSGQPTISQIATFAQEITALFPASSGAPSAPALETAMRVATGDRAVVDTVGLDEVFESLMIVTAVIRDSDEPRLELSRIKNLMIQNWLDTTT